MKRNKKGFTLIELLAVIIILGVLMLIAIPSVTEYISSSRKNAYVSTAQSYVSAVRTKVNQGEEFKFYDPDVFYLVQVGHEKEKSLVSLEKGGASPFNDEWDYAYVGVTYNGDGYSYYFMARDASGQGIDLISADDLSKQGGSLVITDGDNFSNLLSGAWESSGPEGSVILEYGIYGANDANEMNNGLKNLIPTPMVMHGPPEAPAELVDAIHRVTNRSFSEVHIYAVDPCKYNGCPR